MSAYFNVLGVDPNTADNDGNTAVHIAANQDHREIIAVLAELNADLNKVNRVTQR